VVTVPAPTEEDPAATLTKGASRQYVATSTDDIPTTEILGLMALEMVTSLTS